MASSLEMLQSFIILFITRTKPLAMNDIINNAIDFYVRKGRKIEVIRRYIRLKYRVNIDRSAFQERVKNMHLEYEV